MTLPRIIALAVAVLCGYLLLGGSPIEFNSYADEKAAGYSQGVAAFQYTGFQVDLSKEHPGTSPDDFTPDNPEPSPSPSGKCTNCGGTGRVGDGRVSAVCKACGGDGVVSSKDISSKDISSKDISSKDISSKDISSKDISSKDISSKDISSKDSGSSRCQCKDCDCNPCLCSLESSGSLEIANASSPHYAQAYQAYTDGDAPMVVYIGADWCGPCQQLKPQLEAIDHLGNVVYLDADDDAKQSASIAKGVGKMGAQGSYGVPILLGYLKVDGKHRRFILDNASQAHEVLNGQVPAKYRRTEPVSVEFMQPVQTGTVMMGACSSGNCGTSSMATPVRRRLIRWGR